MARRWFRPDARTTARIETKPGGSPVTEADLAVDRALEAALRRLAPSIPYLSEERAPSALAEGTPYFLIDPIDGTRNFIEGGTDWCVAIALVANGKARVGAVVVPGRDRHIAAAPGAGLARSAPSAARTGQGLRLTGPRALLDWAKGALEQPTNGLPGVPAMAHRLVLPALGDADLAFALPGGHDWDIAAPMAILAEAGAALRTLDGAQPVLRPGGPRQPGLVAGTPEALAALGEAAPRRFD